MKTCFGHCLLFVFSSAAMCCIPWGWFSDTSSGLMNLLIWVIISDAFFTYNKHEKWKICFPFISCFRFHVEDRKSEHLVPHDLLDQTKRYRIEDSKVDGFAEELANLFSVLKELEEEIEFSVLEEKDSDMHEDSNEREGEACESVFLETVAYVHEDVKKIGENETESFVFMEDDSNTPQDNKEKVEEEKTEESFFTDTDSVEASSLVEEPRILTFSFQQNYIAANSSLEIPF